MNLLKSVSKSLLAALSFMLATLAIASPAHAQATRTWVSGVGDDVNPCSRTAPCKTFAGAISKTSAGGEINCLDPGGYGTVTITKSITIDCEDTQGSILASSTNGVNINDSASGFANTIRVTLRGLSINGAFTAAQNAQGNPGSGLVGVNFTSGAVLTIEDCIIQNFNGGTAAGVRIAPAASALVSILNSHIVNNGAAASGAGVFVQPAVNGNARITIENTQITGSTNAGVRIDTTGNTGGTGVFASIKDSALIGNASGVVANQPAGAAAITMLVGNSVISNNPSFGFQATGATVKIRIGSSVISKNGTAGSASGGAALNTYQNNEIFGNTADGTFVPASLL